MKPTIGRIVIFHDPDFYEAPHPAIITAVRDQAIDLTSFPPGRAPAPHTDVQQAEGGGTLSPQTAFRRWQWPQVAG